MTETPAGTCFEEYVAARRPALLRAARAIAGDAGTAEDLLQTALTAVCPRWGTLRDPDAYVRRAMTNQQASWHRSAYRRRECPFGELPEPEARWRDDQPVRGAVSTEGLWPLVAALPPRQRAAVALRYYEGLSEGETAAALGCSLGAVKSNTHRGIATLRRWALERDLDLAG